MEPIYDVGRGNERIDTIHGARITYKYLRVGSTFPWRPATPVCSLLAHLTIVINIVMRPAIDVRALYWTESVYKFTFRLQFL